MNAYFFPLLLIILAFFLKYFLPFPLLEAFCNPISLQFFVYFTIKQFCCCCAIFLVVQQLYEIYRFKLHCFCQYPWKLAPRIPLSLIWIILAIGLSLYMSSKASYTAKSIIYEKLNTQVKNSRFHLTVYSPNFRKKTSFPIRA